MKSVLLNTTVIGSSVKLPRHPKLIIGDVDEYSYGDILDANAVKKEISDAVSHADLNTEIVQQRLQEVEQELRDRIDAMLAQIVGAAPEALNTLKEIADALGNDPEFASKINLLIEEINQKNIEQDAAINQSWNDVAD